MTAKQFFKSTGFKSVIVLLVIALVSSFLLTVLHYLWPAYKQTIDLSAVAEMYDNKSATFEAVDVDEENATNASYGTMDGIAKASDSGYVFLTTGTGGYGNGTVTIYTAIRDGAVVAIQVVSTKDQSYWGDVEKSGKIQNYVGKQISQPIALTDDVKVTGATRSSTALNNSVNMAAWYAREVLQLGENVEGKSKEAINALEGYESATITALETKLFDSASLTVDGANYMMAFDVNGNEAYTYKIGDTYYAYIVDSTTRQVVAKTEGAEETIDTAITTAVTAFNIYNATVYNVVSIAQGETTVVYELYAKSVSNGEPNDYKLRVTVTDGKIADFVVLVDGATNYEDHYYGDDTLWKDDDTVFDGKDESGLNDMQITTGATNSNKTVINALKFALKDYTISKALQVSATGNFAEMYELGDNTATFATTTKHTTGKQNSVLNSVIQLSNGDFVYYTMGKGGFERDVILLVTVSGTANTISKIDVLQKDATDANSWWDQEGMPAVVEKYIGQSITNEIPKSPDFTTGASYSSAALNNAINAVVYAYQNNNK